MAGKRLVDKNLYVACIDLTGKRALVVGAGPVAFEKIEGLLACDAQIRVVAPDVAGEVEGLERDGLIELRRRRYEPGDLDGCFLAVAATSDTELNTRVHHDAEAASMLVNVVDVPALCNFILPAIVRTPPITIAVSTAGASPALAKRIKREAAAAFGPGYALLAAILNEERAWAKDALPTYEARRDFFEDVVNGTPDPIALLEKGDEAAVRAAVEGARQRALERLG